MRIRLATDLDRENIREIHLQAFPESERQLVSLLAVNLLVEATIPQIITIVAEQDSALLGHIAFSPLTSEKNPEWQGYILAPLGIRPQFQKRQIGSKLVNNGLERLSENGVNRVFVYGDPKFYSRFGFRAENAARFLPPYELQYPFGWQAIVFNEFRFAKSPVKLSCVNSLKHPELW